MSDQPSEVAIHKLTVARTARYATAGASPRKAERLWIVFHGYGETAAGFMAPFANITPADTRIVAPEGLSRFYAQMPRADGSHLVQTGATWLTRDDRDDDLRDAMAMLHAVVAREHAAIIHSRGTTPRLCVLGFSQGVAMSMRFAVDLANNASLGTSTPLATHVLWAGGLAHDVTNDALRHTWRESIVRVVLGSRDQFANDSTRAAMRERMAEIGVNVHEHTFDGGHRLHTPLLRELLA
jgi:predicted esterase